ncbi:MAG: hypothetical protein AAGA86_13480 [Bacteroidota bacterium]
MPANPKYLSPSVWSRFAKISAALLGGYLVSAMSHVALGHWVDRGIVAITASFSTYLLWIALMIWAFLARNGWKIWGIYLLLLLLLSLAAYIGKLTTGTA